MFGCIPWPFKVGTRQGFVKEKAISSYFKKEGIEGITKHGWQEKSEKLPLKFRKLESAGVSRNLHGLSQLSAMPKWVIWRRVLRSHWKKIRSLSAKDSLCLAMAKAIMVPSLSPSKSHANVSYRGSYTRIHMRSRKCQSGF